MPAQTRSSRGKAPASRVYHSSPAPVQAEFPRRRRAVKTYSRQPHSARSLRQQTLTQLGYVDPVEPEQFDMASTPDGRPQKRRKTMGDTPSSSFHTQTLTQLLSTAGDKEDILSLRDSDEEKPSDEEQGNPEGHRKTSGQVPRKALSHVTDSRATSMIPQTPVHKKARTDVWEVPSSQQTPDTPLDTERFRIPPHRSPLQEKTANAPPPMSETATKRPRTMVIEDSYNSAPGFPSSDPARTPFKTPKLPFISESTSRTRTSMELGESTPARGPASAKTPMAETMLPAGRRVLGEIDLREIPDSDDELQSLGPSPVKSAEPFALPSTPGNTGNIARPSAELLVRTTPKVPSEDNGRDVESSDQESDPGSPTPVARKTRSNPRPSPRGEGLKGTHVSSAQGLGHQDKPAVTPTLPSRNVRVEAPDDTHEDVLADTPLQSQKSGPKSSPSQNTQSSKVQVEAPGDTAQDDVLQDTPTTKSQFYTQGLESQRVPLEVIRSMAPQTDRSDIIVSIHPEPADLIADGSKDHEFRNYKIPNTVSRIWIYITRPECELRYMATIGPAKQPGEIDDDSGVGNREFNAGAGSKFAYELLQVYQLNNPVSLDRMKENGWVESPPQKYVYIPPAVVGQLLGNLRCALFDEESQSNQQESHRILSTPQEIEDQLRSDILHSTQLQDAIVLSSQDPSQVQQTPPAKPTSDSVFARPQLPASRTPTSVQRVPSQPSQPSLPSNVEANAVRPSQATTASEPSSPAVSPEKSVPRPDTGPSALSLPEYVVDESPVRLPAGQHYSINSSQIRLPESLLVDDDRPPPVIWDSDDEEGES